MAEVGDTAWHCCQATEWGDAHSNQGASAVIVPLLLSVSRQAALSSKVTELLPLASLLTVVK